MHCIILKHNIHNYLKVNLKVNINICFLLALKQFSKLFSWPSSNSPSFSPRAKNVLFHAQGP